MKKNSIYVILITVLFFSFFSCSDRNLTEVLEPILPQGERLFEPNWKLTSELDNSEVTSLELSFNTYIIAASENGNFFRTKYNGDSWTLIPASNYSITNIHRAKSSLIFAGNSIGELLISSHNGRVWERALSFSREINSISSLNNNSVWVGTTNGLYYSDIINLNFQKIDNNLLNTAIYLVIGYGNTLFVSTREGLLKSDDFGDTWSQTNLNEVCYCFAVNSDGEIFVGTSKGVFSSKDKITWNFKGLRDKEITALAITRNIHIFAGTSRNGVFYSHNNGADWVSFGLENKRINSILEHPTFDMILAGVEKNVYWITAKSHN